MSMPYEYPLPDQDYEVLVVSYTYNHEKYIEQTLKGIVMQQTNFKFVALILDDCSTDGTADIIRDYERKYPDLIKGIYEPENYFSQGKSQEEYIQPWRDRSKYQAFCEGDDYWTDPLKLQKQYDFMESHPDCSLSFHNVIEHWKDEYKEDRIFYPVENREYFPDEIIRNWVISTCSVMFKTDISRTPRVIDIFMTGRFLYYDVVLFYSCASEGKLYGLSDVMGVYQRLNSGYTQQLGDNLKRSRTIMKKYCDHHFAVVEIFGPLLGKAFEKEAAAFYQYQLCRVAINSFLKLDVVGGCSFLCQSFSYSVFGTIKVMVKRVYLFLKRRVVRS